MTSFRVPAILDNNILQNRKNVSVCSIADRTIFVENSHDLLYDKMHKLLTHTYKVLINNFLEQLLVK